MSDINFSALTDEELLRQKKKNKSNNTINAVLIGFLIGVSVYSAVKSGFSWPTFFPLILAFVLFIRKNTGKELDSELKARNL